MRKWAQHPGVCLSWASIACRIVQTLPSNLCRQAYQAAGVSSDDSLKASYWNSEDLIAYFNNLSVTFIHCPLIDFRKSLSCILSILQFITLSLWGLRGYSGSYVEANAFDGDANTPWVSACSSCAIGEALIGIVGVFLAANQTFRSTLKVCSRDKMAAVELVVVIPRCKAEEVRCIKLRQCTAGRGDFGCPLTASRMQRVSLLAKAPDLKQAKNLNDSILSMLECYSVIQKEQS